MKPGQTYKEPAGEVIAPSLDGAAADDFSIDGLPVDEEGLELHHQAVRLAASRGIGYVDAYREVAGDLAA